MREFSGWKLTISWLGTLLSSMSELVAVAALDESHIAWLRALLGHVALLATVTAPAAATLGTVASHVSL